MQLVLSSEIAPRPSEIAPRSASSQQGPGAARRGAADGVGAQGTTYGAFDLAYDPIAGHWAGGSPTQEAGYEKGRHASGDDGGDGGAGGGGDGGGGLLGAAARCADLYATTPARLGTCRGHTHFFLELSKVTPPLTPTPTPNPSPSPIALALALTVTLTVTRAASPVPPR